MHAREVSKHVGNTRFWSPLYLGKYIKTFAPIQHFGNVHYEKNMLHGHCRVGQCENGLLAAKGGTSRLRLVLGALHVQKSNECWIHVQGAKRAVR